VDGARQHRVKDLKDFEMKDRKKERNIAEEIERKQKEVEDILKKKKEEEHRKRLEFEEQRIKEENDKMKKDAEEKRKRDLEDAKLQEILKVREESRVPRSPVPTLIRKSPLSFIEKNTQEDRQRREEEVMIQLGREEHFKELEKKRKGSEENKLEEATSSAEGKTKHKPVKTAEENKLEETTTAAVGKTKEKPVTAAVKPVGNIEEYTRPTTAKVTQKQQQELSTMESPKTLAVVEPTEEGFSSFNVFQANKQLQKPKYQTFNNQSQTSLNTTSSSSTSCSSSSRMWQNVNTGLVKDRTTAYLHQDSVQSQEPSPRATPRLMKKIFRQGTENGVDNDAPWRRGDFKEETRKKLETKEINENLNAKEIKEIKAEEAVVKPTVSLLGVRVGREERKRSQSPAVETAVEELTVTMAELEILGAKEEKMEILEAKETEMEIMAANEKEIRAIGAEESVLPVTKEIEACPTMREESISIKEAFTEVKEVAQQLIKDVTSTRESITEVQDDSTRFRLRPGQLKGTKSPQMGEIIQPQREKNTTM